MKRSWLPSLVTLAVLVFFFAPLVMLVVNSFNASRFGGEWEGFTWQWYERLWDADEVWDALFITLKIAAVSSVTAMVLGTLAAYALHRFRSWLQSFHSMLVTLPLVMPDILMGMSLLAFFVALGVVMAAHGYPLAPRKGDAITGLPAEADDAMVFHAGTVEKDGVILSAGGRVLCVTALADSVKQAQQRAYDVARGIHFDGMQYRRDIGYRAIKAMGRNE